MHPFDFTDTASFVCEKPNSAFVFNPGKNNKFHWYGRDLDKLGSYAVAQTDALSLELTWNYGREKNYTVISFDGTGDAMIAFVMQDSTTGEKFSFSR